MHDNGLNEVIELYLSQQAAQAKLAEILTDEPGWHDTLEIVAVHLGRGRADLVCAD